MKYACQFKTAIFIVALVTCFGCKAKQDKPGASSSAPEGKAAQSTAAPHGSADTVAVPSQDMADARTAAGHVLTLLEAGDFPAIYKGAAPGFKQLGSEDQFVAKFQQARQKVGELRNPVEASTAVRPDKSIVLVYRMENERFTTDMRLSFTRAQNRKMELAGLNQHDEPKK